MDDVDPKLSRLLLAGSVLGAALNLASSVRTRGPRRAAGLFALGVGLPAVGELLATGPLGLLRHRTRPRVANVPVAVLLGWYCATNGSLAVAEKALDALHLEDATRERLLPPGAALVGTSLDLVLDPAGLDAGLWEWSGDGSYAAEVAGANGRNGVPLVNYAGWLLLVGGVASAHNRTFAESRPVGRLPALLLLPPYLAAVAWAVRRGKVRYVLYSALFPVALAAGGETRR
ncbi:carotenoid biosynthesis protein [Rubrobacter tropicus]|nr:carotenoid biosynthesis protein [Rubrobacter tropicus]